MVGWKEAFDQHTQMPKASPLPSALFINHGFEHYDSPEDDTKKDPISLTPELDAQCRDTMQKSDTRLLFHINPMSGDGIYESFSEFIQRIIEDNEENHRSEDVVDDLWDESIRVKQRVSQRPPPASSIYKSNATAKSVSVRSAAVDSGKARASV
jgi:hypothetical protein